MKRRGFIGSIGTLFAGSIVASASNTEASQEISNKEIENQFSWLPKFEIVEQKIKNKENFNDLEVISCVVEFYRLLYTKSIPSYVEHKKNNLNYFAPGTFKDEAIDLWSSLQTNSKNLLRVHEHIKHSLVHFLNEDMEKLISGTPCCPLNSATETMVL